MAEGPTAELVLERMANSLATVLQRYPAITAAQFNLTQFVDDVNVIAHEIGARERTAQQWGIKRERPAALTEIVEDRGVEPEPTEQVVATFTGPLPVAGLGLLAEALENLYGMNLVMLPFKQGETIRVVRG